MGALRKAVTVAWLALGVLFVTSDAENKFEARKHWWDLAQNELMQALNVRDNWNVAKNVVIFLGDGMGITVNTAARIYKGQKKGMNGEEGFMAWERFPNAALLKTYNVDKQVPDSAATATAYLCGVKTNYYTLGVDPAVTLGDCAAARNPIYHTPSILQWAQEAGKDTGFVTTTRVTHATPGALYAHSAHRNWECDGHLGQMGIGCKDIADQLITDNPGRNMKVILGGGRQMFGAGLGPVNINNCIRGDGRDLTREWLADKDQRGNSAHYVTNAGELADVDLKDTDYLMGLFSDSHMPFEVDRQRGPSGPPSLTEMTLSAIKLLSKNDDGFFLLVEGGRIDHALHDTKPHRALEEAVALDSAVAAALEVLDLEETMVVVTADHSHVMTINGYPDRGSDILGLVPDKSPVDGLPYTTLMFTNGPGYNYSVHNNEVVRHDPSTVNTRHIDYRSQSAVPMPADSETHGGEDVGVWAAGPMSHLFHRTHEQHYVAHAMAYAACIGPSAEKCQRPAHAQFTRGPSPPKGPLTASANAPFRAGAAAMASVIASVNNQNGASAAVNRPKFPTLSPILQSILDDDEEKIVTALGKESVTSFVHTDDVKQLLGRNVLLPHSM